MLHARWNTKGKKPGRNRELVLAALRRAEKPMRAYTLLNLLREQGLRAPLQVYRELDRLVAEGLVHKIESLSAFAPCTQDCGVSRGAVFTICVSCGQAHEVHEAAVARALRGLARKQNFRAKSAAVELSGLCETCASGHSLSDGSSAARQSDGA